MPSANVTAAVAPDQCAHFLYLRHDAVGDVAQTDSLVLVRVTRDSFECRPVYSRENLHIDWRPVGVSRGKLYGVKLGALVAIDLETGTAVELDRGIQSFELTKAGLYAFVRQPAGDPVLREYDFKTEAYRDISARAYSRIVPSKSGGVPPLRVAPDHKWLAYFCRSNSFIPSHMYQLHLVAVDSGELKTRDTWIRAREFITGSGEVADGPPFAWLDSKTILVVRDASKIPRSMMRVNVKPGQSPYAAEGGMPEFVLVRVDIESGRMTDFCRLPKFEPEIGEPFFRAANGSEMPRLVLGRLGQYRVDLLQGCLVKDDGLGGGYRYRRRINSEELLCDRVLLDRGRTIPEVAVAPGGQGIVWQVRPLIHLLRGSHVSTIRFHDAQSKSSHTVATEWIPRAWDDRQRSFEGNLMWISAEDLKPAASATAPSGWLRLLSQPDSSAR